MENYIISFSQIEEIETAIADGFRISYYNEGEGYIDIVMINDKTDETRTICISEA